jgi:DNA-binding transcriptional LysR family regulator
VRGGRNLVLTEASHVAVRYADEIFALGQELVDAMQERAEGPRRLVAREGLFGA